MSGPWDDYAPTKAAAPEAGPWADYAKPAAPKKRGLFDPFVDTVAGAADRVKQNLKEDVEHAKSTGGDSFVSDVAGSFAKPFAPGGVLRGAKVAGDLYGAVTSPISGAINVVAEPLERATRFGGDKGLDLNQALMAAKPGGPVPVRAPPPPKINALAAPVAAFDRAGIDPMLATATGGRGMSTATNVVAENALAGPLVRNRLQKVVGQADASAQRLAGQYGEVRGPQITGENVQSGVVGFANSRAPGSFKANSGKLYDDAFAGIESGQAAARQRADAAASLKSGRGGQSVAPVPVIDPSATTTVVRGIEGRGQSPALKELFSSQQSKTLAKAIDDPASLSFQDLRDARTWVREARGNPQLNQGIGSADLGKLESALTADIYANAQRLGGGASLQKLKRADQHYRAGQARIERALQPFADAKSGETAYARIRQAAGSTSAADAQQVLSLKRSLQPDEFGDVAANLVAEMGKPSAGTAAAGGEGFSPSTFVTNYNKMAPRSREILFGAVGGGGEKAARLKAELDNLAVVVDRLKGIEKGANASKTAVNAQSLATGGALVSPAAPAAATLLGSIALTGEAMTNPTFVRWLARSVEAKARTPQAYDVFLKQLGSAAKSNAALIPLYQQQTLLLAGPKATTAVAAKEPQGSTPQ